VKIAPRLVLALGFVGALSTLGLGWTLRDGRRGEETRHFDAEVVSACSRIRDEVKRQAEADRKLVDGACHAGEFVDRALVALEAGTLEERRLGLAALVPSQRAAFDLDGLVLATNKGEVLGADPRSLLGLPSAEVVALAQENPAFYLHGSAGVSGIVSRCTSSRSASGAQGAFLPAAGSHVSMSLVGMRRLEPLLARLGKTADVAVALGKAPPHPAGKEFAEASCVLTDAGGQSAFISVAKSKDELFEQLGQIDRTVTVAVFLASSAALVLAFLLARGLSRPIEQLAAEAKKVASGEAQPLRVRGSGEITDLSRAFDHMIEDLESTRRRLAATSRVAAWREVARRVAHEVKNPLAPIRAAVETLRRLRARQDPAFDEYFDEATRTVLDEVHRISNIVTEFTRFARLSPPRPVEVDLVDLVKQVVTLQKASAPEVELDVRVRGTPPKVMADRDQIIQVMTNLVQNALDAVKQTARPTVLVSLEPDGRGGRSRVIITVSDNGPGIAPEIAARLFEPYATTKPHGTGLGLAIAQRIAIEHDGELSLVVTGGPGATFRLALPLEGPPPLSESPPSSK
jgi:two-component system nitrogen regulation sensor histidine kinase NtrY